MAIIGKLIRQQARADAYERAHPEAAAERIRYRAAAEQALADTHARFPVLTTDNFAAANAYREARTKELLA
jgi:hypothetical protein